MDPVSRILLEREGARVHVAPFAVLAVGLHAALAGAIFFAARGASSKPAHLPVVAVKFVRPQPKVVRREPAARPAQPAAKPTAAPAPEPTAAPTKKPATRPKPEDRTASDNAMQSLDATPQPTRPPQPATGGSSGARRSGVSLGGDDNGGGGVPGIPSDFQFSYYVNRMLSLIESHWYKPPVVPGTSARAVFTIHKSGKIDNISLESSSGVPSFDRAVLRALYATNPLPPLPPAYTRPSLTVHLTFSE